MDGIHDLGGMDGFGAIARETDEPVFHAAWERRMFALALAAPYAVPFCDDDLRREIERIAPARYLALPYYGRWLEAIEAILGARGVADGRVSGTALPGERVGAAILAGATTRRPETEAPPPRFMAGDGVMARNRHPAGHTRLPRYVRGRRGVVHAHRGVFVFPDSNAAGMGENPQHLYTVRFAARELWGDDAPANDRFLVDLFDPYLEPL